MYESYQETLQSVGWWNTWLGVGITFFLRYLLLAGLPFWLLFRVGRRAFWHRKLVKRMPRPATLHYEIRHSLMSCLILSLAFLFTFHVFEQGWGKMYLHIEEHGWWYFTASIPIVILLHDTYFYWLHRLLHMPFFFKKIHFVHHRSVDTNPFSSFSFHLWEAVLEFAIVPILTFILPLHVSVMAIFGVWVMGFNILGHLGYDFFPKNWQTHPIFRWLNTTSHHQMHHTRVHWNFGLYFNFWDWLLKTNHPDYFSHTKRDSIVHQNASDS